MSDEIKTSLGRLTESMRALRDMLSWPKVEDPQHLLKRELEAWFRSKGYGRKRSMTAVAAAFNSLHRGE